MDNLHNNQQCNKTLTQELSILKEQKTKGNKGSQKNKQSQQKLDQLIAEKAHLTSEIKRLETVEVDYQRQSQVSKKLSDSLAEYVDRNAGLVEENVSLENEVDLLKEAINLQQDEGRRNSKVIVNLEERVSHNAPCPKSHLQSLTAQAELEELKVKIANLMGENNQLREMQVKAEMDSSAMSVASEQSSIIEVKGNKTINRP